MIYYKNSNELYHEGVDGQRWGVRHGPPYPLTREAKEDAGYISKRKAKRIYRKSVKERKKKIAAAKEQIKKEAEIQKKKEAIKKKPNANEVYENRYLFTPDELKSLYNELKLYDDIKRLKTPEKTTLDKAKNAAALANEFDKGMTSTLKALKGGAKLYNDIVDVGSDVGWWDKQPNKIDLSKLGPQQDKKK